MKTRKVSQESLDPGFSLGKKMAMSSDTGFAFLSSKHGLQRRNSQSLTWALILILIAPEAGSSAKSLLGRGSREALGGEQGGGGKEVAQDAGCGQLGFSASGHIWESCCPRGQGTGVSPASACPWGISSLALPVGPRKKLS